MTTTPEPILVNSNPAPVTDEQLNGFCAGAQKMIREYYKRENYTMYSYVNTLIVFQRASKYTKVFKVEPREDPKTPAHQQIFCFIENSTGNILKPATYKAPAKHARGHVNTPTFGVEFVGPYGPQYLR